MSPGILLQCADDKNGKHSVVNRLPEACELGRIIRIPAAQLPPCYGTWFPLRLPCRGYTPTLQQPLASPLHFWSALVIRKRLLTPSLYECAALPAKEAVPEPT